MHSAVQLLIELHPPLSFGAADDAAGSGGCRQLLAPRSHIRLSERMTVADGELHACCDRVLALSTLAAVGATWAAHRRAPLPPASRRWLNGLLAVTAAQVGLLLRRLLATSGLREGRWKTIEVLETVRHWCRQPLFNGLSADGRRSLGEISSSAQPCQKTVCKYTTAGT